MIVGALGHQRARSLLAAYVLDAVDSLERELVHAHLEECVACTQELAELERAAHAIDAAQEQPPPAVWDAIEHRIEIAEQQVGIEEGLRCCHVRCGSVKRPDEIGGTAI